MLSHGSGWKCWCLNRDPSHNTQASALTTGPPSPSVLLTWPSSTVTFVFLGSMLFGPLLCIKPAEEDRVSLVLAAARVMFRAMRLTAGPSSATAPSTPKQASAFLPEGKREACVARDRSLSSLPLCLLVC